MLRLHNPYANREYLHKVSTRRFKKSIYIQIVNVNTNFHVMTYEMASKLPEDHLLQLPPVLEFFLSVRTMLHVRMCVPPTEELEISFVYSTMSNRFYDLHGTLCMLQYYTTHAHVNSTRSRNSNTSRAITSIRPFTSRVNDFRKLRGRIPPSRSYAAESEIIKLLIFLNDHIFAAILSFDRLI